MCKHHFWMVSCHQSWQLCPSWTQNIDSWRPKIFLWGCCRENITQGSKVWPQYFGKKKKTNRGNMLTVSRDRPLASVISVHFILCWIKGSVWILLPQGELPWQRKQSIEKCFKSRVISWQTQAQMMAVASRRLSQELEKWINLGAPCLVWELIHQEMLHDRMVHIPEDRRAAGALYRRLFPLSGSEANTEWFIRERAASDKKG